MIGQQVELRLVRHDHHDLALGQHPRVPPALRIHANFVAALMLARVLAAVKFSRAASTADSLCRSITCSSGGT
jgi:hypothetical protein